MRAPERTRALPQSREDDVKPEIKEAGPCKKTATFTIASAEVDKAFEEKFEEVNENVPLPGFRVGRAPQHLLEKKFGKYIAQEVTSKLLQDTFEDTLKEEEWDILGDPDFDIPDDPAERGADYSFGVTFELRPSVEVDSLDFLKADKTEAEVKDEDVQDALERAARSQAKTERVDEGGVPEHALVTCRISACVMEDGEEQEFYASEDLEIDLDDPEIPGLPLPALGEALLGKAMDEQGSVEITLPDDYPDEEWRGLPGNVVFEVLEIKRREIPAIDDAFAEAMGAETLDELRERVRDGLRAEQQREIDEKATDELIESLCEKFPLEMPEGLITRTAKSMLQERLGRDQVEESGEVWDEACADARKQMHSYFLLEAIAEDELIFVSDRDIDDYFAELAPRMGMPAEQVKEMYDRAQMTGGLRRELRERKTREHLLSLAREQS